MPTYGSFLPQLYIHPKLRCDKVALFLKHRDIYELFLKVRAKLLPAYLDIDIPEESGGSGEAGGVALFALFTR